MPLPVPYIRDRGGPCYTLSYSSREGACKYGRLATKGGGPGGGAGLAETTAAPEKVCASATCDHTAALPTMKVELQAPAPTDKCTTLVLPPSARLTREYACQVPLALDKTAEVLQSVSEREYCLLHLCNGIAHVLQCGVRSRQALPALARPFRGGRDGAREGVGP